MRPDELTMPVDYSFSFTQLNGRVNQQISVHLTEILDIMKEEGLVELIKRTSKDGEETWKHTTKMTKLYLSGGMVKQRRKEVAKNFWTMVGIGTAVGAVITGIIDLICDWKK